MTRAGHVFGLYFQRYLARRTLQLLLLFALSILLADTLSPNALEPLRRLGSLAMWPADIALNAARKRIDGIDEQIHRHFQQARRIDQLLEQNRKLQLWKTYAHGLAVENQQLQKFFVNNRHLGQPDILWLRVSDFQRTRQDFEVRIDLDSELPPLPPLTAVINQNGLIGRVLKQDNKTLTVMRLEHPESRIPVQVVGVEQQVILAGRGHKPPELEFFLSENKITPPANTEVFTSGTLGYLPAGLPVGTVLDLQPGVRVDLHYTPVPLRYVGVIHRTGNGSAP